jgi:RNA polymerase sigma-70 factor, ECF subfamily
LHAMTVPNNDLADERIIEDVLAGKEGAFIQLVNRYKRKVFSMSARFARDKDDLDDICQDIFIKIYENLGKFRSDAPFEHWLSRIAIRTCYDALRKRRKEKGNVPLETIHYQIAAAETGEDLLAAEQARSILEKGMAQLKPAERLVITLLELEEKPVREIADLTGWSEVNVKVRAFRARQKLKRILEKHHER